MREQEEQELGAGWGWDGTFDFIPRSLSLGKRIVFTCKQTHRLLLLTFLALKKYIYRHLPRGHHSCWLQASPQGVPDLTRLPTPHASQGLRPFLGCGCFTTGALGRR